VLRFISVVLVKLDHLVSSTPKLRPTTPVDNSSRSQAAAAAAQHKHGGPHSAPRQCRSSRRSFDSTRSRASSQATRRAYRRGKQHAAFWLGSCAVLQCPPRTVSSVHTVCDCSLSPLKLSSTYHSSISHMLALCISLDNWDTAVPAHGNSTDTAHATHLGQSRRCADVSALLLLLCC
jgi:hypothetical protein